MKGLLLERPVFLGAVFLILFVCSWPLLAATLQVELRGSLLEIEAEGVPLGDVLTAVSARTGLVVKGGEPLTDVVTCRLTDLTLEQGIRQLMKHRNYALTFADAKGTVSSSPTLWILGKGGSAFAPGPPAEPLITQSDSVPAVLAVPDDRKNVYLKEWFAGEVEDPEQLSSQFSAAPSEARAKEKGIVITNLSPDSVLQKIGVSQGDLVSRVNGRPVGSVEEFISALQSVPEEASTIMMIERRKADGHIDPVYVHLD